MGRLITSDFHIHTNLSDCAHPDATPEAVVRAAQEAGLEAVGISDHIVFPDDRARPAVARDDASVAGYRSNKDEARGLRVYVGCEAEMHSPTEATIDGAFAAGLDFVVMSPSHLHNIGPEVLHGLGPRAMAAFILELTRAAVEMGFADIIAHPLHVPESPFPFEELVWAADETDVIRTAQAAAQAGVAMECNPRFLRAAPQAAEWLWGRFLEAGCKLAIGSDAHHPDAIGCRGPRFATEEELRAVGISEDRLWRIEDRVSARRSLL